MSTAFCPWCGGETTDVDEAHERCRARLSTVDPPRYCAQCARRMVVQVDPMGWTARCSRHGETTSTDAQRSGEHADGGVGPWEPDSRR